MSKIATCPNNPEHKTFLTVTYIAQDWLVDGHGNFLENRGYLDVLHKPSRDNVWLCDVCDPYAEAVFVEEDKA